LASSQPLIAHRLSFILVISLTKSLTKITGSLQILLLLHIMVFSKRDFCVDNAYAKISLESQNAVAVLLIFSPKSWDSSEIVLSGGN
jgi:hypothetical protein